MGGKLLRSRNFDARDGEELPSSVDGLDAIAIFVISKTNNQPGGDA
jgi:hypothetical protein